MRETCSASKRPKRAESHTMIGVKDTSGSVSFAIDTAAATPAVREGILAVPGTWSLHYGGRLDDVQIAWRLVGDQGPLVVALGGISAGRYVTAAEPKGWWADV